ncbi:hypothetical protein IT411_02115 [Candidatus Peregrinibacteria bacterium]|nr:hypothetical protein [Candidatus Peregrinibacteria bacterium]
MANKSFLHKLIRKAKPKQPKTHLANRKGTSKFLRGLDPERYYVYRRLIVSSGNLPAILIMAGLFAIPIYWTLYGSWTWAFLIQSILIVLGLIATFHLLIYLHYLFFFRNWRQHLKFSLDGWEKLVNHDKFYCDLCWHHTTIKISSLSIDPEELKGLEAALKIFCDKANKRFYTRDQSADDAPLFDLRKEWTITNHSPLTAEGSSTPEIINLLRRHLLGNFNTLAKTCPGLIDQISLEISNQYQEVDIYIETSGA